MHKHVQEWSAEQILDCWAIEEAALIEAKAYFNKHAPAIQTCLRLLVENNQQQLRELIQNQESHTVLKQMSSARLVPQENSEMTSTTRSIAKIPDSNLIEAYN